MPTVFDERMTIVLLEVAEEPVTVLIDRYVARLALPTEHLWVTTCRTTYAGWIGRRVPSAYGGAYCFLKQTGVHAILINLTRIDQEKDYAVEVVVAEELLHMRDHVNGDTRRHAHHGHDRIARRVSDLTGVSLGEIRSALLPPKKRPLKYLYQCPGCQTRVRRRRRGTWSCGRCAPRFDSRFVLEIVDH